MRMVLVTGEDEIRRMGRARWAVCEEGADRMPGLTGESTT
jgi:hypothetical protein